LDDLDGRPPKETRIDRKFLRGILARAEDNIFGAIDHVDEGVAYQRIHGTSIVPDHDLSGASM